MSDPINLCHRGKYTHNSSWNNLLCEHYECRVRKWAVGWIKMVNSSFMLTFEGQQANWLKFEGELSHWAAFEDKVCDGCSYPQWGRTAARARLLPASGSSWNERGDPAGPWSPSAPTSAPARPEGNVFITGKVWNNTKIKQRDKYMQDDTQIHRMLDVVGMGDKKSETSVKVRNISLYSM